MVIVARAVVASGSVRSHLLRLAMQNTTGALNITPFTINKQQKLFRINRLLVLANAAPGNTYVVKRSAQHAEAATDRNTFQAMHHQIDDATSCR